METNADESVPRVSVAPRDLPDDLLQLFHDLFWGEVDSAVAGGTGHERDADWLRLVNGIEEFLKQYPTCAKVGADWVTSVASTASLTWPMNALQKRSRLDPLNAEAAIEVAGYELNGQVDLDRIRDLLEIGLEHLQPGSEDESTLLSFVMEYARTCGFDDLARKARDRGLKSYSDGDSPEA